MTGWWVRWRRLIDSPAVWLAVLTLVTAVCVYGILVVAPWKKIDPDYICYWAAGKIVASGHSPYDEALETQIQHERGWNKATDGLGRFDFLPYYYPPWFAAGCALLVPLGFDGAKAAWFALNLEALLLSGYLLRDAVPGLPRSVPPVAVPVFGLSVVALFVGQTSILMLFLLALAWKLMNRGNDHLAGAALACLTTKPQLAAALVLALLLWSARQRRWGVVLGFAVTLAALALLGAWIVPAWPIEMVRAAGRTPPPTAYFPWIGTTWLLALQAAGLHSWGLWGLYLAVALPFLAVLLRAALDRSRPLDEILSLGLIAPFILAPYGRHYDFPVLLIPVFVLIGRRLSETAGTALLVALLLLPYVNLGIIAAFRARYPSTVLLFPEWTFLWIPLLVTATWFGTDLMGVRSRGSADAGSEAIPR
ncbi:MAG: glycosyltransferase family 87 protein [Isosphaeraceae bacterium]